MPVQGATAINVLSTLLRNYGDIFSYGPAPRGRREEGSTAKTSAYLRNGVLSKDTVRRLSMRKMRTPRPGQHDDVANAAVWRAVARLWRTSAPHRLRS